MAIIFNVMKKDDKIVVTVTAVEVQTEIAVQIQLKVEKENATGGSGGGLLVKTRIETIVVQQVTGKS